MARPFLPDLRPICLLKFSLCAVFLGALPNLHAESGEAAAFSSYPQLDQPYKRDSWRHDDGSYRYALKIDGGVAEPAGSTRHYQNLAGGFGFGAGYNVNKHVGAMLEYSFNDFGVPRAIIDQLNASPTAGFGGRVHLWSITLNPVVNLVQGEATGVYLIGGGGFFRKLVLFGTPTEHCGGQSASCQGHPANTTARFSNNAGGLDLGFGVTHRVALTSKLRAFAEARYVWVDNHSGPGNGSYAPAYYRTGYFPLVVGLKW